MNSTFTDEMSLVKHFSPQLIWGELLAACAFGVPDSPCDLLSHHNGPHVVIPTLTRLAMSSARLFPKN